jgi:hypothetical protein
VSYGSKNVNVTVTARDIYGNILSLGDQTSIVPLLYFPDNTIETLESLNTSLFSKAITVPGAYRIACVDLVEVEYVLTKNPSFTVLSSEFTFNLSSGSLYVDLNLHQSKQKLDAVAEHVYDIENDDVLLLTYEVQSDFILDSTFTSSNFTLTLQDSLNASVFTGFSAQIVNNVVLFAAGTDFRTNVTKTGSYSLLLTFNSTINITYRLFIYVRSDLIYIPGLTEIHFPNQVSFKAGEFFTFLVYSFASLNFSTSKTERMDQVGSSPLYYFTIHKSFANDSLVLNLSSTQSIELMRTSEIPSQSVSIPDSTEKERGKAF